MPFKDPVVNRAYQRRWAKKRRDSMSPEEIDRVRARDRAYREKHLEILRARKRKWMQEERRDNPDKVRIRNQRWAEANPALVLLEVTCSATVVYSGIFKEADYP